MKVKRKILWLRLCYWLGAVLDGLSIIPMLVPEIGGMLYGIPNFNPGIEYRYAMGVGASLMAGWTLLLIWADRKPVERRDILLLALPVLIGQAGATIYLVSQGAVAIDRMVPQWILQVTVFTLFSVAYIQSRSLASSCLETP